MLRFTEVTWQQTSEMATRRMTAHHKVAHAFLLYGLLLCTITSAVRTTCAACTRPVANPLSTPLEPEGPPSHPFCRKHVPPSSSLSPVPCRQSNVLWGVDYFIHGIRAGTGFPRGLSGQIGRCLSASCTLFVVWGDQHAAQTLHNLTQTGNSCLLFDQGQRREVLQV